MTKEENREIVIGTTKIGKGFIKEMGLYYISFIDLEEPKYEYREYSPVDYDQFFDGMKCWYKNGELHRDGDEPAVIDGYGNKQWWSNGRIEYYEDVVNQYGKLATIRAERYPINHRQEPEFLSDEIKIDNDEIKIEPTCVQYYLGHGEDGKWHDISFGMNIEFEKKYDGEWKSYCDYLEDDLLEIFLDKHGYDEVLEKIEKLREEDELQKKEYLEEYRIAGLPICVIFIND